MNKTSKIIVTAAIIIGFIVIFAIIVGVRTDAGYRTPGALATCLFFGLIGAIRSLWEKDENQSE